MDEMLTINSFHLHAFDGIYLQLIIIQATIPFFRKRDVHSIQKIDLGPRGAVANILYLKTNKFLSDFQHFCIICHFLLESNAYSQAAHIAKLTESL